MPDETVNLEHVTSKSTASSNSTLNKKLCSQKIQDSQDGCYSHYESLVRLYELEITSLQELFDFALEEAIVLTNSSVGYILFYDEKKEVFTLYSWSKDVMSECMVTEKPNKFYLENTGIWGEVVRQRQPLIISDYSEPNPLKKGCPKGHVKVHNFLSIPVWQGNQIVAVVAVGNKKADYTNADVKRLDLFAKGVWGIAQKKEAEDALKKSEEKYRAFFESSIDGILLASPDGRIHQANPAACRMLGWNEEEFCRGGRASLLDEADPATQDFIKRRAIDQNVVAEQVHKCKDGSKKIINTASSVYLDYDGESKSCVILHDITERKRIEAALRASEQRFRAIFDCSPLGISVNDTKTGRFIEVNQSFTEILGLTREDMLQGDFARITHPDDLRRCQEAFVAVREGLIKSFSTEKRYIHKNGGVIWVKLHVVPLWLDNEPPALQLAMVKDITKRKHNEQLRDEVESIIRHDIKAPLLGLFNMAQLAKKGKLDENLIEWFPQIDRGIRQILYLLDAAEPLKKMERGEYCPGKKPFKISPVLQSVKDFLKTLATSKKVSIIFSDLAESTQADDIFLSGEEFLIEDMLMNLIKNAIEASPANNKVSIRCKATNDEQKIAIHNMGIIPEAIRDRFFDKYSSAGKSYGVGLGTYSAQLIAKAHGGRIGFSTSEEEGTTVDVILPRCCPE